MLSAEEKAARVEARRVARREAKEQARIAEEKAQRPVDSITIKIEWSRSRVWGSNPHAEAEVHYKDGLFDRRGGFICSGCGYDKESTVIAEVFNSFLKYKLWEKDKEQLQAGAPYGIRESSYGRGYSGGIGTSCYYDIAKFIGGTFEHVASGKTFDVYKYTDKGGR